MSRRSFSLGFLSATALAAAMAGPLAPVTAHVGGTIDHLFGHLKPKMDARYVNGRDPIWAQVIREGTSGGTGLVAARTKGFESVRYEDSGIYCLTTTAPAIDKRVVMVTAEYNSSAVDPGPVMAILDACSGPDEIGVYTSDLAGQGSDQVAFFVYVP